MQKCYNMQCLESPLQRTERYGRRDLKIAAVVTIGENCLRH